MCCGRLTSLLAAGSVMSSITLLCTAFSCALAYNDVIRGAYMTLALGACVLGGRAVSLLWLPVGGFSAAVMLLATLLR